MYAIMNTVLSKTTTLLLLVLFAIGLFGLPAQAQAPNADKQIREMLAERDQEIKKLLGTSTTYTAKQRAELKELINRDIDFVAMGKEALGPHWDKLTAVQRTEFVEVFSDIVRAQSLSNLDIYKSTVTYDKITVDGKTALVQTTTVYKEVPTKVEYEMAFSGGAWKVNDFSLDEVSTAEGFARSFQTVIRKKGFDSLMTSLNKKRDKIQAAS